MMQCLRGFLGLLLFWAIATTTLAQSTLFFPPQTTNPTCNGSTNGSIIFSFQGDSNDFFLSWSGGNLPTNGNPTSGDGVISQTGLSSGTYSIFILDLNSGFDTTIQTTLNNPPPISINAGNIISNCLGQPINLSATTNAATGSVIVWTYTNANGPQTLSGKTVTVPAVPAVQSINSNTTITVSLTDPNGCTANSQVQIIVNLVPVGSANPTTQTICSGRAIINLVSSIPSGSFTWTVGQSGTTGASSGTGNLISQIIRASGSNNGTATYSIRPVSSSGCVGQVFTSVVTIKPKPVITASPDSSSLCSGSTTNIALSSSTPNSSFAWNVTSTNVVGATGSTGSSIQQLLNTTATGGKSVYKVVAQLNGCESDSLRVPITVKSVPSISVSPADTINVCSGQVGAFTYSSNVAGAQFNWLASTNEVGGISGTGASNSQTYTNTSTATKRVTYTINATANGCTSATKLSRVRVRPIPTVSATASADTICSGNSFSISLSSNIPNSTFTWTSVASGVSGNTTSGSGSSINQTLTSIGNVRGTVIYSFRATNESCQGPIVFKTIFVDPFINIPFTISPANLAICSGSAAKLKFTSPSSGVSYSWTIVPSGVSGALAGAGDSLSQILTNSGTNPGFVDYVVMPKQGSCNGIPQTRRVNVNALPAKPIITVSGGLSPLCPGQTVTLTSNQIFGNQWFKNGVAISAPEGTAQSFVTGLAGFYKLRFTNSSGCSNFSDSIQIQITTLPTAPVISGNSGFCPGGNTVLKSSVSIGNQWQINGIDIPGATDTTFSATIAGSYSIKRLVGTCTQISELFMVSAFPNPTQPNISGNNFICAGDTGLLTSSNATSYQWIRNGQLISGATNSTLTITQGGNYTVRIGDANSCQATSNIYEVQSVGANPIPTIIGNTSFCPSDSTILTTNNNNPAWKNQWYRNGQLLNGDTLKTLVVRLAGTYTVMLKSPRGCVSTSLPTTVQLLPTPEAPLISGLPLICTGGTSTLTSSATTGNVWFLNGSQLSGANNATYLASGPGTYSVLVSNLQGCKTSSLPFTLSQTTAPLSTANLTNPTTCAGANGKIAVEVTGGSGSFTYQWSPVSGGIVQGQQNQMAVSSGIYSVFISDQNSGCSQVINGIILNDPANFTVTAAVTNVTSCSGSNGSIVLTTTGSQGPFSFAWTPTAENSATLTNLGAGYYSVQVTDQNSNCKVSLDSIRVGSQAPPKPSITASGPLEFCAGDSVILTTTAEGPYQWARVGQSLTGETTNTLVVKTSGNYYVRTANPNFPNCFSRSDTVAIVANPLPANPSVTSSNTTVCAGITVSISTTSVLFNQWLMNGEPILGANGQFIEVNTAGTYCLKVTDANGCSRIGNNCKEVTVNPIPPLPVITADAGFCPGSLAHLNVSNIDTLLYQYTWLRNNQFIGSVNKDSISTSIGGWFKIRALNQSTSCRIFSDSVFVESFNNPPSPTITGPSGICLGSSAILTSSQGNTYQWFRNGEELSGETNQTLSVSQIGLFTVRITNGNGCAALSASFAIGILPKPTASIISGIASFCNGSSQILTASTNANYAWLFNGVVIPGAIGETLSATQFGNYQVIVVSSSTGCSDTSTVFTTTEAQSNFEVSSGITGITCTNGQAQNNGSITLTVTGGSGNYSFQWTPTLPNQASQSGLPAGAYAVVVTDAETNCQVSVVNLVVEGAPEILANAIITGDSRCDIDNGSIALNPTGGSDSYTYNWTGFSEIGNSLTNLPAGSYSVQITDVASQCSQSFSNLIVIGPDTLVVDAHLTQPTTCGGTGLIALTIDGGSGLFNIHWQGTGTGIIDNQAIQSNLSPGNYQVTITDTVTKCQNSLSDLTLEENSSISFVLLKTDPTSCGGSDGSAMAETGQSGIVYQWKNLLNGTVVGSDSVISGLSSGNYRLILNLGSCKDSTDFQLIDKISTTFTAQGINPTCDDNDGSITITLGNPSAPVQVSIIRLSDGNIVSTELTANGLSSGQYRIRLREGICADSALVTINKPTNCDCSLQVIASSNPVTCAGGNNGTAFAFVVSGGTGPFSYQLNNGPILNQNQFFASFTNQPAGPFTVVVTDEATFCQDTVSQTIGTQVSLIVNAMTTNPSCGFSDGQIRVVISGGTGPYSVSINSQPAVITINGVANFSGLLPGNYSITVTDATPCVTTLSDITLSGTAPLAFSFGNSKPATCFGSTDGAIQLNNLSGSQTGYQYLVAGVNSSFQTIASGDSIKNLAAGTYNLTIRAINGCEKDTTFVILGTPKIDVSVGNVTLSACHDSTGSANITSVSGGHGAPYSYSLLLDAGTFSFNTQLPADSILRNLTSGNYHLIVADGLGCSDTTDFSIGINTVAPLVSVSASKTTLCQGDTITLTADNSAFIDLPNYTWYLNGQLLPTSGGQILLDTLTNGDSIQVKINGSSDCLEPDSAWSNVIHFQVLPANARIQAQIQAIHPVVCIGQSAQLQAYSSTSIPDLGYRWIVNGIELPTDTNAILNLFPGLPLNSVRAVVFTRSTSSCIAQNRDTSDIQLVTQIPSFTARDTLYQVSPSPGELICANTPVVFSVSSNLKNRVPYLVQWFRNDTLVSAGIDTFFTFNNLPNQAKIRAHVVFDTTLSCVSTNAGHGLDSTKTLQINVLPTGDIRCLPCNLTATATVSNINCAGANSGSIQVTVTGGTGNYVFSLLPNGPSNQTLAFFFGLAPGTYGILVRDTVTNCTKIISNLTISISNNYNAVVASVNPTPCAAQPDGKLEFVSITDGSGDLTKYKYRISALANFGPTSIFTGLPAGNYLMEAMDTLTGCLIQISRTLTAPAALQSFASVASRPTCYGQFNGSIRLDSVKNGFGLYQYSLTGDPGSYAGSTVGQPLPQGFGAGSYQIFFRDLQSGCLDTVIIAMTQPDSIRLSVNVLIGSQCFAPTGQFKIMQADGGSNPLTFEIKYPGSNTFLPMFIPVDSTFINMIGGLYIIQAKDLNQCTKQILVDVPINSPKAQEITVVKPCIGDTNGVIRLSGLSGGTAPYTFILGDDQGNEILTQTDTVFANLKPGIYRITMKDNSAPACEVSYQRTVDYPQPIQFNLVGVTNSTCENFDGVVRYVITGGSPGYRYSFDSLANSFTNFSAIDSDTLTLAGLSTRAPENLYTLRLLDSGPNGGCSFEHAFNVPGNSPLRFVHRVKHLKCHSDNSGAITIDSLNGTGPVRVKVLDSETGNLVKESVVEGEIFLNNNLTISGLAAGSYNVQVVQFGACNASRVFSVVLNQPTAIEIFARNYKSTANGFALGSILLDSVRGSFTPYLVSFNESLFFPYQPDTLFNKLTPGQYRIEVKDSIGCLVSKEIEVAEDQELFVPTMFTPNGDGMNDQFEIRNLPENSSLKVTNRWGKEVYSSSDYSNNWDGKDEDEGIYFWTLKSPGQGARNGWVNLKR